MIFDSLEFASCLLEHLGEKIRYYPAGREVKEIRAVITRDILTELGPGVGPLEYRVELLVSRSDVSQPSIGADEVELYWRPGDANYTRFRVAVLLDQVAGFWRLGLA